MKSMFSPFSLRPCLPLFVLMLVAGQALAQTTADPSAAVQRSLEQGIRSLSMESRQPASPTLEPPEFLAQADIARLTGVKLLAPQEWGSLSEKVNHYWQPSLGRTVSGPELQTFSVWLWQQLTEQGYLGFISLDRESEAAGERLVVKVTAPRVASVTVVALGSSITTKHSPLVARRVGHMIQSGQLLDVRGIEKQIEGISYDLPVRLDASLRQVASDSVDVVVEVRDIPSARWEVAGGLMQFNNHGLAAFGRPQWLGQIRVNGSRSQSELSVLSLVSEGVRYLRTEYSEPWAGLSSRWNIFASSMRNEFGANAGVSDEVGLGLTSLLSTSRYGTVQTFSEFSHRQALSRVSGSVQRSREDRQLRLGLATSHAWDASGSLVTRTTWSLGDLQLRDGDVFQQGDANLYRFSGIYRRLETSGAYKKTLDEKRLWSFSARWRAQWADKNLDTINQIALGGLNGIRAFGADEGVGDQGGQVSLDLVRQLSSGWWSSVFYDEGRVRALKNPLALAGNTYSLQGTGFTLGGDHGPWSWSATAARSLGAPPVLATAIRSQIGDWRAWVSLTRRF